MRELSIAEPALVNGGNPISDLADWSGAGGGAGAAVGIVATNTLRGAAVGGAAGAGFGFAAGVGWAIGRRLRLGHW